MNNREIIFYPLIDEAWKANEKLNKLFDDKLKTLNIGDQEKLVTWFNYPVQGKRVCNEIKSVVLNQGNKIGAIKIELQRVIIFNMPKFWNIDDTPIMET